VRDEQEADFAFLVVDEQVVHLADVPAVLVLYFPSADVVGRTVDRLDGVAKFDEAGVVLC
jgi:hypothetical protein